ncbi:hypothetical protein M3Y99_00845300 [Aphelenchoides fujianensis]|nr:hypothetical protein M3Y99_00845300 [Aphelenchoides fujianensis]
MPAVSSVSFKDWEEPIEDPIDELPTERAAGVVIAINKDFGMVFISHGVHVFYEVRLFNKQTDLMLGCTIDLHYEKRAKWNWMLKCDVRSDKPKYDCKDSAIFPIVSVVVERFPPLEGFPFRFFARLPIFDTVVIPSAGNNFRAGDRITIRFAWNDVLNPQVLLDFYWLVQRYHTMPKGLDKMHAEARQVEPPKPPKQENIFQGCMTTLVKQEEWSVGRPRY